MKHRPRPRRRPSSKGPSEGASGDSEGGRTGLKVDLHGLAPEAALRKLAQELHAARVSGAKSILIVTGRGWGNARQEPILRKKVEAWLAGPEGERFRVREVHLHSQGGALDVRLG